MQTEEIDVLVVGGGTSGVAGAIDGARAGARESLCIMEGQITATRLQMDRPDLLIFPRVGHIIFMELFLAGEMIAEGYRATREALSHQKGMGLGGPF